MNTAKTAVPAVAVDSAHALVAALPTPTPLTATPRPGLAGVDATSAVSASYVGATSADVAVVILDQSSFAAAAGRASVDAADVLRPSLEAATATLGAGVLGEVSVKDAAALFLADDATVFELSTPNGAAAGWYAIRVRHAAGSTAPGAGRLSRIRDVEMTMTVEIGRTRMSVREALDLEPGSVVELDRSAGAPADILLNGRVFASGEVVVVDQDYAVRITKIHDSADGLN